MTIAALGTPVGRVPAMPRIWVALSYPSMPVEAGKFSAVAGAGQPERFAPAPAPQHQHGDDGQADREAGPDALPLPAPAEGQPGADADANRPIADEGEDHRHPRVVEPA